MNSRSRIVGAVALTVAFFTGPSAARAGEPLVLLSSDVGPYQATLKGFAQAFGGGHQTVTLSGAVSAAVKEQLKEAALVVAVGPDAAKTVSELGIRAPVVLALVTAVDKLSFAERPSVVPMFVPAARQLKLIRAAVPSAKRVGILVDPSVSKALAAECESAAAGAGVTLVKREVANRKDVAIATRELLGGVDLLWLLPDTTVISAESFRFIIQEAMAARVPVAGFSEGMAKAGAFLAVSVEYEEMGRRAALVGKKRLAGDAGAGLEISDGSVYLSEKSARLLGMTFAPGIRAQAATVFQ